MGLLPGSDPHVKHSWRAFSSFSLRRRKLPLFLFMTWNVHQIRSSDSGVSTPGRPLSFQQTPSYSQLGMRLDERRIPVRPAGEHRDSKHVLTQQGTSPDMPVRAKKKRSHRRAALVPRHPSPPKNNVEAIDSRKNLAVAKKERSSLQAARFDTYPTLCSGGAVERRGGHHRQSSMSNFFGTDRYEHIVPDH